MGKAENPLFHEFDTPHSTTPFSQIKVTDYEPAVDRGIALALQEVEAICNNRAVPDFDNTIVALENVGKDLDRALNVFGPLVSALSDDDMMELSMRLSPKLSEYSTTISLNPRLWEKIKYVYDHRDLYDLDAEDKMLLNRTYDNFVSSGALLEGDDREEYRNLNARLSELTTKFGQNVLKELNTYEIWLPADSLQGLPQDVIDAAALAAKQKGREGEYMFTLAQPTYMAFMKYSDRRDLREKMYKLYTGRNQSGEFSNVEIMKEIADVRYRIARLLGYDTYAAYSLHDTMAEKPENVYKLLDQLRDAYRPAQEKEFAELKAFVHQTEGTDIDLKPWDYSYYANKLKNARYSYDEEALRPYFELGNVVNGVFGLATKLYGLSFEENPQIEAYHPEVKAYEVKDSDGSYLGVIYTDFFPRESKRPGAWMTDFKPQWITADGINSRPHVSIVMNFTKPTETKPSLLTPYEVETFLHEFGHALHGLLANTKYSSLSGTNVYRDFVELPSQFNENYLTQKEFLDGFARHYVTGETIPSELVDKIIASAQFGAAYQCMRQLNFGYVDMAWHTIKAPVDDAEKFEKEAAAGVAMFEYIPATAVSPQFSHIFSGGYAAGYYSYKWAEVLDADAFAKFEEDGIFNQETARKFRTNVLMKGGTENPAELYRRFRGQEPTIDALLRRDGIVSAKIDRPLTNRLD
ncbi:MAG: M3 family metallopeptidase [Paramuribaculum sp.]|nr:M3 family metallopeptidase [Paramuribaculum sp.]